MALFVLFTCRHFLLIIGKEDIFSSPIDRRNNQHFHLFCRTLHHLIVHHIDYALIIWNAVYLTRVVKGGLLGGIHVVLYQMLFVATT